MMMILDKFDPRELGERLRAARGRAGLTQDAAAKKLSLARTTLIAIEKGERRVQPEELRNFAAVYDLSVNAILRPTTIVADLVPRFRALKDTADEPAAAAARMLNDLAAASVELERLVGEPLKPVYPPERPVGPGDIREQAEDAAMELRQRLGLGLSPISDMVSLLELDLGVRVFVRPIVNASISGLFVFDLDIGACILLNQNHPRERRAMTAAHELGHLVASRNQPDVMEIGEAGQTRDERFSIAFAAALLMPAALVRRRFSDIQRDTGRFSPRHLILLAHHLNVSEEAMARRLEDLKLVPGGTWASLKERGFSGALVREVLGDEARIGDAVMPPRLWFLAAEAYRRQLVTEAQLARMMHMDLLEVRQVLNTLDESGAHDSESLATG